MLAEAPTAYLPIGPLGWEGDEVPLGQAGIRARQSCERAAARTGGVTFPCIYWRGFGTGSLPFTLEFDPAAMRYLLGEGLLQLGKWGFEKIVVCDGGGASPLSEVLSEQCERMMGAGESAADVELTRASFSEDKLGGAGGQSTGEAVEGSGEGRDIFVRFEESRPGRVREQIERSPIAYVPLGALEWHGEHGPLGLDGIKAHHICECAAERTGGVVFPTVLWGAFDTMPFPFTFHFERKQLESLVRPILRQLSDWGFEVIVLLTGHYPPTQIKMLREQCRSFNRQGGARCAGVPEMAFATDIEYFGDHAGMWESSIMLAIQPEWVDLSAMPSGLSAMDRLTSYGTMGKDPTAWASAEKGRAAIDRIVHGLSNAIYRVMAEQNDDAFEVAYRRHARANRIFSPRVFHLIREALDVHSIGELVRYLRWTAKNS